MKNRFTCIVMLGDNCLHKEEYKTLQEISDDLNLTYQQVADCSSGRPNKIFNNKFKYSPQIRIEKISQHIV